MATPAAYRAVKVNLDPEAVLKHLSTAFSIKPNRSLKAVYKEVDAPLEKVETKITEWKRQLPWFRQKYDNILAAVGKKRGNGRGDLPWYKLMRFLEYYRSTRKKVESAKLAGTNWPTIQRRLVDLPENNLYDRNFHMMFKEVEIEIEAAAEDMVREKAFEGKDANKGHLPSLRYLLDKKQRERDAKQKERESEEVRPTNLIIAHINSGAELTGKVVEV